MQRREPAVCQGDVEQANDLTASVSNMIAKNTVD